MLDGMMNCLIVIVGVQWIRFRHRLPRRPRKKKKLPLFDRLQSLLVEVDDESGSEDDDDDIVNLPSYSEDGLSSPNKIKSSPPTTSQDDDGSRVDVSALTLDQRTFIQLSCSGIS